MLPADVKEKFLSLQRASSKGSKGLATRQYWVTSARKIGLVDTARGIRFGRDPSRPEATSMSLDILAQVAFNVTTASRPLVLPEDKPFIAEFLYVVMEQLQPCRFTEADRNKRRLKDVGCIGVECKHCAGQVDGRKFFWSSVNAVESNFVSVHTHMMECRMAPDGLKKQLAELKMLRKEQTAALKTGSQKAFFSRVWGRLHGSDGDESTTTSVDSPERPPTDEDSMPLMVCRPVTDTKAAAEHKKLPPKKDKVRNKHEKIPKMFLDHRHRNLQNKHEPKHERSPRAHSGDGPDHHQEEHKPKKFSSERPPMLPSKLDSPRKSESVVHKSKKSTRLPENPLLVNSNHEKVRSKHSSKSYTEHKENVAATGSGGGVSIHCGDRDSSPLTMKEVHKQNQNRKKRVSADMDVEDERASPSTSSASEDGDEEMDDENNHITKPPTVKRRFLSESSSHSSGEEPESPTRVPVADERDDHPTVNRYIDHTKHPPASTSSPTSTSSATGISNHMQKMSVVEI